MQHLVIQNIADLNNHRDLVNEMWQAYEEAFPYEERRKRESVLSLLSEEAGGFYILLFKAPDEDGLAAFAMLHRLETFEYIEYLCVPHHKRSGGWGAKALKHIFDHVTKPIVLEAEPPGANEWSDRRIDFYRRNGFTLIDQTYYQPAYHEDTEAVELRLMVRGQHDNPEVFARELYRHVYRLHPSHILFYHTEL